MQINSQDKAFRAKTIRGISWSIVGQVGQQGFSFIITIILARLLSPREFGLVAMIVVISGFIAIFAEMGLSAALVHKQDVRPEHLSSVFWLNLGIGILLAFLFVAAAPWISAFYKEPILAPLAIFMASTFLFGSLTIVQKAMMVKMLDFRTLAITDVTAVVASGTVSILLALTGFGVWSLAIQSVLFYIVTAILVWRLSDWRPNVLFRWAAIKDLGSFGMHFLGSSVLNYWVRNLDYLLIGKFLGNRQLGMYKNSYSVMLFPLNNVSRVLSRVMFPSLSLIQKDMLKVRNVYLRMTRFIALFTFPLMAGLFVVSEPFVLVVFGPKWSGMIPLLQVLSLTGLIQSVGTLTGNVYLSQGRADLQFRVGIFLHANAILGIIVGLRWGSLGVAVGYSVASLINSFPSQYFAGKLIKLSIWQFCRNLSGLFFCSVLMAVLVWRIGVLLPDRWPAWLSFLTMAACGIMFYGAFVHLLRIRAYIEFLDQLKEFKRHGFCLK